MKSNIPDLELTRRDITKILKSLDEFIAESSSKIKEYTKVVYDLRFKHIKDVIEEDLLSKWKFLSTYQSNRDTESFESLTEEEVKDLEELVKELDVYNVAVSSLHNTAYGKLMDLLSKLVDIFGISDRKKKSLLSECNSNCKISAPDLSRNLITEYDQLKIAYNEFSGKSLLEKWKMIKDKRKFIEFSMKKQNDLMKKSLTLYMTKYKDTMNLDKCDDINGIIQTIDKLETEDFIRNNFPDGKEIDIDCCGECETWTVGEHRCSCGNRRMSLCVEGNVVDGYYGYGEPY